MTMRAAAGLLRWVRGAGRLDPDARYRLGVSSSLFSGVLPEGSYYPDFTTLEDHRPLEFLAVAGAALRKPWPRCTVLDLGCGEGMSTLAIARTGARVIGIEGRPAVVARAQYLRDRLGYINAEFRTGDVLDGSLWEGADAVFASGLIHHLQQPLRLMELVGQHCSDLAYFCTHFAPRNDAQRTASFFSSMLHEPEAVDFRGRPVRGIRFAEGGDSREQSGRRRRHPRAGIGNTYSWWPSEEGFIDAMGLVGFPVARRLAVNDHRLRYRYCFRRGGEVPDAAGGVPPYFWSGPARPMPESALERALVSDIHFLKRAAISPAVMGTRESVPAVGARLLAEGIRPSVAFVSPTQSGDGPIGNLQARSHASLEKDGPEFVVLACSRLEELRRYLAELVTLKTCRYAFTSFTLPEIGTFPALLDPITGEPVDGPSSSGMRY